MSDGGSKGVAARHSMGVARAVDVEPILDQTTDLPTFEEVTEPDLFRFTPARMSRRQLRLWLQHTLHRNAATLERLLTLDIAGPIDGTRFVDAWSKTVEATPALRLTVTDDDDNPKVVVSPLVFEPTVVDGVAPEAWDEDVRERLVEPLALKRAAYASVLYVAEDRARWYLRLHSIAADLWSMRSIVQRLSCAYRGRPLEIDDRFGTFVERERRYRKSPESDLDAAFWAERLDAPYEAPQFYGKHASHDRLDVTRRSIVLTDLGPLRDLTDATHRPSGVDRAPRSLPVLAAATVAFLARVTGAETLGLAVPIDMRSADGVGPLTELCPLRIAIDDDDTFRTLLRKIQDDLYTAAPRAKNSIDNRFGKLTYDALVDVVDLRFDTLGDATTSARIETAHREDHGVESARRDFASFAVQFGRRRGGEISVQFELANDAFDDQVAQHLPLHFEAMLVAMTNDVDQPIGEVDILSTVERTAIAPSDSPRAPEQNTLAKIVEHATAIPTRTALVTRDETLDYRTLIERAAGLAEHLKHLGVGAETRVAIGLDRNVDLLVAILATHLAGGAFVPLDPSHPRRRTAAILADANPAVLLTRSRFIARLEPPATTKVVALDTDRDALKPKTPSLVNVAPDHLAYLIYTSGSTGTPKGVAVEHGALTNLIVGMAETLGLNGDDRWLAVTTPSFDIAILELMLPLFVGGTVVLADDESTAAPSELANWLTQYDVTAMQATPATWRALVDSGWTGHRGLTILCGGEPLPSDLAASLLDRGRALWNVYGPTETTIWSSAHRITPEDVAANIPIGVPVRATEMFIRNDRGFIEPDGITGELCIGGAGLARGYNDRPDLTAAAFITHPFDGHRRIYRTGDLARRRPDGIFECFGRLDTQVKVRGFRIELGEIEVAVRRHPQIRDAAVIVREDRPGDRRIVAYLVAEGDGLVPFAASLREYLTETLPRYMIPASFVVVSNLPMTPNGKVDRRALTTPPMRPRPSRTPVRPRNDLELQIVDMWRKVLQTDDISIDDGFFDLGGHSLHAVAMLSVVRDTLGAQIPVADFFEHPDVASLARLVEERADRKHHASVIALERQGTATPLFCVCGLQLYQDLAIALAPNRPVYGVLSPAEIDFLAASDASTLPDVRTLAKQYADAIVNAQPVGPYAIAGVSFGGLLAFEAARILTTGGARVSTVVLLDAVLDRGVRGGARRWVANRVHGLLRRGRDAMRRDTDPVKDLETFRARTYDDRARDYEEQMQPYEGNVVIVRAHDRPAGEEVEDDLGWRFHVRGHLDVYEVPGDHLGILQAPNASTLARKITPHLDL